MLRSLLFCFGRGPRVSARSLSSSLPLFVHSGHHRRSERALRDIPKCVLWSHAATLPPSVSAHGKAGSAEEQSKRHARDLCAETPLLLRTCQASALRIAADKARSSSPWWCLAVCSPHHALWWVRWRTHHPASPIILSEPEPPACLLSPKMPFDSLPHWLLHTLSRPPTRPIARCTLAVFPTWAGVPDVDSTQPSAGSGRRTLALRRRSWHRDPKMTRV